MTDRRDDTSDDRRDDELLSPGEVAQLFGVNPKTVARWADQGKLQAVRTLGGHRRFRASEVRRILEEQRSGNADDDRDG